MKGILIIILVALAIVVFLWTSKTSEQAEPYAKRVIKAMNQAEKMQLDSKIIAIKKALEAYYFDNDRYPEDLEELVPNYLGIEENIKDPWGEIFKIEPDGEMNLILISSGKDRVFGNKDDIERRI